jgi:hypothetical protein
MKYDEYIYHFSPVEGKYKGMRRETLFARHGLSSVAIDANPDLIEYQRTYHRKMISDRIGEAIYDGWFPVSIRWEEGTDVEPIPDFSDSLIGMYVFYTRVDLVAPDQYPLMSRRMEWYGDDGLPVASTMARWHPKDLK